MKFSASNIFSKESFSYISGNGNAAWHTFSAQARKTKTKNSKKVFIFSFISENKTFWL